MKLSPRHARGLLAAWLLAALSGNAMAHSWPQETRRLAPNGTMIGAPGYDRAHVENGGDTDKQWLLPPNDPSRPHVFLANDKIARPGQRALDSSSYSDKFPKLKVAPGDFAAIIYTENGHVTRPDLANNLKPINRGTVYLYGTTNNDLTNTNLVDVHLKWTADGKGGDGKGKLLATRNYDDGQCHEVMPADGDPEGISTFRQKFITESDSLACQSDLQIPEDAEVGKTLTVIWVWDWPNMNVPGVAVPPASYQANTTESGKFFVTMPELYTGVVDFDIVDPCDDSLGEVKGPTCEKTKQNGKVAIQFNTQQAASTRGVRAQMANPFLVSVPQAGFDVSAATADPTNIPLHGLIGTNVTAFPIAASILSAQNQYHAAPPATTAPASSQTAAPSSASSPRPTSALTSASTSASASAGEEDVVTVTVTVPQSITTVTVTREGSGGSSSASASTSDSTGTDPGSTSISTPAAAPTVTQFFARGSRIMRGYRR